MSIAVHPNAVTEVKRRIADFNENLRNYLNTFENPSEVYQVLLAFYPLSQTTPNEEAI